MKKKLIATFVAVAVALGLSLAVASPASAADANNPCTNWSAWYNGGGSWGQARFCYWEDNQAGQVWWRWQVQDTLTDGYAVHLEACTDWATYPWTCTNVGGQESPFFGDVVWNGNNPNTDPNYLCTQSTGSVTTSGWSGNLTENHLYDPDHSRYSVRVVKGRCSGGAHQSIAHFDLWLSD